MSPALTSVDGVTVDTLLLFLIKDKILNKNIRINRVFIIKSNYVPHRSYFSKNDTINDNSYTNTG